MSKQFKNINSVVVGKWVKFSGICTAVSTVEIFVDKTALVNNVEYDWNFCDCETQSNCFYIKLFTDENSFKLKFVKDRKRGNFIMKINADCFCNKNDYEIIEIDETNYSKYFEIKEYCDINNKEFYLYWCLKDCFVADIVKSSLDCEVSWVSQQRILECYSKSDYNILNVDNTYSKNRFAVKEFNACSGKLFSKIGNTKIRRIANSQNNRYLLTEYPTEIKMESIMGTLYLYRKTTLL